MQVIQGIFDTFAGKPDAGPTALAKALDEPISTVQSWKVKGAIPRWHRASILDAARVLSKELPDDAIIYLNTREKQAA
jgi:hypothetical protein